jgi:AcrR family transcriptional regulator
MKSAREDRRVARTRRALREALVALILEKGYEAITIQDLIDRADIGRSTFYAHYLDKQDLLMAGLAELREYLKLRQQAAYKAHGAGQFGFSLAMFEHAASHAPLYRAMVGKQSGAIIHREFQHIFADLVRAELAPMLPQQSHAALPPELVVQYVVSAYMGLLTWWLDNGLPYAAGEIDRIFQGLTLSGLRAGDLLATR